MEKVDHKICLDTDFLVNFLRNKKEEVEFINQVQLKNELATTTINIFELYYGAYKSSRKKQNLQTILLLMQRITLLDFSQECAKKAAELLAQLEKEGKSIEFRDLFIGTTALVNNFSLATGNKEHFSRIEGLRVI